MGEVIAAGVFALGGVVVGSLLNVFVDRARWRRDWLVSQINRRVQHYSDLLDALYAHHVLLNQAAHGRVIPDERRDQAVAAWRTQLTRTLTSASPGVQHAGRGYDEAQAATASAINERDAAAITAALATLDQARVDVLVEIQKDQHDINTALASRLLSPWQRRRFDQLRTG